MRVFVSLLVLQLAVEAYSAALRGAKPAASIKSGLTAPVKLKPAAKGQEPLPSKHKQWWQIKGPRSADSYDGPWPGQVLPPGWPGVPSNVPLTGPNPYGVPVAAPPGYYDPSPSWASLMMSSPAYRAYYNMLPRKQYPANPAKYIHRYMPGLVPILPPQVPPKLRLPRRPEGTSDEYRSWATAVLGTGKKGNGNAAAAAAAGDGAGPPGGPVGGPA